MSALARKAYKIAARSIPRETAFALAAGVDMVAGGSWGAPLARSEGTFDLLAAYPALASPAHRRRISRSPGELCRLMSALGSDKGLDRHNYTQLYDLLLGPRRETIKRLFELGIGSTNAAHAHNMGPSGRPGASLRGWQDYLTGAQIFAADIDRDVLVREERIACFWCDQTDPQVIARMWTEPELAGPIDVIIDDGMHEFDANRCFLEASLGKLAPNGLFVVEDVRTDLLPRWRELLPGLLPRSGRYAWAIVQLKHPFNTYDNNLVLVVPA